MENQGQSSSYDEEGEEEEEGEQSSGDEEQNSSYDEPGVSRGGPSEDGDGGRLSSMINPEHIQNAQNNEEESKSGPG